MRHVQMQSVWGCSMCRQCNSYQKQPHAFRQEARWCTDQCTVSIKISLGIYLKLHYNPPANCHNIKMRVFLKDPKIWNMYNVKTRLWAGCLSTFHHMAFNSPLSQWINLLWASACCTTRSIPMWPQWFRLKAKEFFGNMTCWLVHQWYSCLNACGGFL